jgi:LAO/AO transport system kinase
MGDGIQAIKAGILEVGDIFVINKADRDGTGKTLNDLRMMLDMDQKKFDDGRWKPPILQTEAVFDKGVEELLEEMERHRKRLTEESGGVQFRKREDNVREELAGMVKNRLIEEMFDKLTETREFEKAVESIVGGDADPYTACENLVLANLGRETGS